jgi:DNA-binding PadR family transcriptional regulator
VLEFVILKIVSTDKVYVADMLDRLSKTEFATQEGTLYPLLSKMRRDGLVDYEWQESEAGPPRKYYTLTAKPVRDEATRAALARARNDDAQLAAIHRRLFSSGHIDERTSRVRSFVRQQPEDRLGDLFRAAATLHGDDRFHAIDPMGLSAARVDLRVDEAGPNGVDADSFLRDFSGELDGHRVEGALRDRVVHILAGRAET